MKFDVFVLDTMKICSITYDPHEIAKGLFDIMIEDHKTLLAFGMIDHSIIEILDRQLAVKFNELVQQNHDGMSPEQIDKDITDLGLGECTDAVEARKRFVSEASTEVSKKLYGVAAAAGAMVV